MEPELKLFNATDDNSALGLAYVFRPVPDPIRVSPEAGNPRTVDLRVIVSNPTVEPMQLQSVVIRFPIGQDIDAHLSGNPKLPEPVLMTPGNWSVSVSEEGNSIEISPSGSASSIAFEGNPLVFTVPGIRINTKPGEVVLAITEKSVIDKMIIGEARLEKLEADFPVSSFTATPDTITDLKQTVKLNWTCTAEGEKRSYSLRSAQWRPRDCLNKNECYTYNDGAAGVTTLPLSSKTIFYLDVIQAQGGQRTIQKTLSTRVDFAKLELEPSHHLNVSPSGRIAKVGWLARNAVRCSVFVDDKLIDENAPTDTYLEVDRYYVTLPGSAGAEYKIEVIAHGATGARTSPLSIGPVKVSEPISLQVSGTYNRLRIAPNCRFALLIPADTIPNEIIIADLVDLKAPKKRIAIAQVTDAAFSSDGQWVLVLSREGLIRVDVASGEKAWTIKNPLFDPVSWAVALAADDKRAFVHPSMALIEVELPSGKILFTHRFSHTSAFRGEVGLGADGKRLAVMENSIDMFDLDQTPPVTRYVSAGGGLSLSFSMTPDASLAVAVKNLFTQNGTVERVVIVDLNSGRVDHLSLDGRGFGVAILPNGRAAIIATENGLNLVDLTQKTIKPWGVVPGRVVAVSSRPIAVVAGPSGVFMI